MLILAPIGLLLLTAVMMLTLERWRPESGSPWLWATSVVAVIWLGMIALRQFLPLQITSNSWEVIGENQSFPHLLLDQVSWPYFVAMTGLALGQMLTASATIQRGSSTSNLSRALITIGVSLFSILAANPISLIFAWMLFDVAELFIRIPGSSEPGLTKGLILSFTGKIVGTFAVIWVLISSSNVEGPVSFTDLSLQSSTILLLAACFRLGIIPIQFVWSKETRNKGSDFLTSIIGAGTSLVFLARLSANVFGDSFQTIFTLSIVLIGLACAVQWLGAVNLESGKPFIIAAASSLAVASVVMGKPLSSLAWGVALLTSGSVLVFSASAGRANRVLGILGFLGLSGLPFIPTLGGWSGIWTPGRIVWGVPLQIIHLLLLVGYLKQVLFREFPSVEMESWVKVVQPAGLVVLLSSQVLAGFVSPASWMVVVNWQAGAFSIFGSVLALVLWKSGGFVRARTTLASAAKRFEPIFTLVWIYQIFSQISAAGDWLLGFVTRVLEGDGGLLWALLLLGLMISIIAPVSSP